MMTEVQWLDSGDPTKMLAFLADAASERKLRLLSCACCRAFVWTLLRNDECRAVVGAAEQYADGLMDADTLRPAMQAAWDASPRLTRDSRYWLPRQLAVATADTSRSAARAAAYMIDEICDLGDRRMHFGESHCKFTKNRLRVARLVRDVFGNPFQPIAIDAAWRTATVVSIAEAAYADRVFDRLPILADALEDAGCTDAVVLDHCRRPGEHFRGCWVVDGLLGKA